MTIRAQVVLRTVDQVPENFVTNSWCFMGADAVGQTTGITAALKAFYDSMSVDLSPVINRTGHLVKYSMLPGTPPNYPFLESSWDLTTAPAGTALPDEVAMCLSFQGDRVPGFPQNRRRGRVYIGPLDVSMATGNRPSTVSIGRLATAGATLKASISALTGDTLWAIWSTRDGAPVEVLNGWVDNAFDTQRRRGVTASSRTTF